MNKCLSSWITTTFSFLGNDEDYIFLNKLFFNMDLVYKHKKTNKKNKRMSWLWKKASGKFINANENKESKLVRQLVHCVCKIFVEMLILHLCTHPTCISSCWTTCIWTLHWAVLRSSRACSLFRCLREKEREINANMWWHILIHSLLDQSTTPSKLPKGDL